MLFFLSTLKALYRNSVVISDTQGTRVLNPLKILGYSRHSGATHYYS